MSFQNFCDQIADGQRVTAERSFIITYTNSKGEAFNISPKNIKDFLEFFLENYDEIFASWSSVESRKLNINNYEEKSYREIYKFSRLENLKPIFSAGSSQTNALTKTISKIICYLSKDNYIGIEENTFFSKNYLKKSLENWNELFSTDADYLIDNFSSQKKLFKTWMLKSNLSEKTALSYSENGIDFSNKFLNKIGRFEKSLYQLSPEEILKSLEDLSKIPDWSDVNQAGNLMYSSAGKKLAEYFRSIKSEYRLSKPFLLLAGISGTGKTRFIREQAKATGSLTETYCLTAVRPDWHEPSDLLGYVSRLNGQAEYVTTEVLQFIAKAWRALLDAGLKFDSAEASESRLSLAGDKASVDTIPPYWLCLDEMNLAPVEQYFADYLSVLETREWRWQDGGFHYLCDPLLKAATIGQLADSSKLRKDLGFGDGKYDEAWGFFRTHGMGIPFNLIVAGTVNMDETTHGFSRKVIDRALSFDFGDFFPNDFDHFFAATVRNKSLTYPVFSQACIKNLPPIDVDGQRTIAFLKEVNKVLDQTPFALAYRALNELLLAVICNAPKDDLALGAVWDDFLMCKVLPRIEGDSDKLAIKTVEQSLLIELQNTLNRQFSEFWDVSDGSSARPDLYRESMDSNEVRISCRSKAKIGWMQNRLERSGFTSFWP